MAPTDANGQTTVTLTNTTAGTSTVTATLGSASQTVDVNFVGYVVQLEWMDSVPAMADGVEDNAMRVGVTTTSGQPVRGIVVNFVATNGAVVTPSATTNNSGRAFVFATSTTPGTSTITATVDGNGDAGSNATDSLAIEFVQNVQLSALTTVDTNVIADGSSTATVEAFVTDISGNPAVGVIPVVQATNGAIVTSIPATAADGRSLISLTSTTEGISTVRVRTLGRVNDELTTDVTFVAPTVNIVGVADNAQANGTATNSVQVTITDGNGNPVAGQAVTITASNGAVVGTVAPTDANGQTTVTLTNTTAGTSTVTATLGSTSQTVDVNFVVRVLNIALTTASTDAVADGVDAHVVTALVTNDLGDPVSGVDVNFNGPNMTPASGTSDLNGEVTVDIRSNFGVPMTSDLVATTDTGVQATESLTWSGAECTIFRAFVRADGNNIWVNSTATCTWPSGAPAQGTISYSGYTEGNPKGLIVGSNGSMTMNLVNGSAVGIQIILSQRVANMNGTGDFIHYTFAPTGMTGTQEYRGTMN